MGERAYMVVQPEYESCECDCGCERDGTWHFEGGIGCRCVNLGCVCARDSPGRGIRAPVMRISGVGPLLNRHPLQGG